MKAVSVVLQEARELLDTARFGLTTMRSGPALARAGLRNVVVFGRMVTFCLQNMKGAVPGFEEWYEQKRQQMAADPLMKFFKDLRTSIEKQAATPTTSHSVAHIDDSVLKMVQKNAPPNAHMFFIGDNAGGSGWMVTTPDGKKEKIYIDLPPHIGTAVMTLVDAPKGPGGRERPAHELAEEYLGKLADLLTEAEARFGASSC